MDGQTFTPRLGIMAVAFGDGTIKIISVPHPDGIRSKSKGKRSTGKAGESQYNTVYGQYNFYLVNEIFRRIAHLTMQ